MARTLYEAIGVLPTATKAEIQAACLEYGQRYRTALDAGDKDAKSRFSEVEEAYETLTDSWKRRDYDARLAIEHHRVQTLGPVGQVWESLRVLGLIKPAAFVIAVATLTLIAVAFDLIEPAPPPLTEAEKRLIREQQLEAQRESERKVMLDQLTDADKRGIRRAYDSIRPELKR